jgi:membrane protein
MEVEEMRKKGPLALLNNVYCRFQDDEVPALGAQLTYYLILAFFPFVIFLITLTAYTPLSREEMLVDLISVLPATTGNMVSGIFDEILKEKNTTLLSIGMLATIWAASNGMMAIIRTLNKAYDEEEHRPYWKVRLISIFYTIGLTIVIWFAFVLLIFGKMIGNYAIDRFDLPAYIEPIWTAIKYVLSLSIMCTVFAFVYYSAPSRRLRFSEVVPGAIFATIGWVITSLLFSYYVNHFGSYTRIYGSLGGIIVLLIWLYISSIIILLGGEINAALTFYKEGRQKSDCKTFGFRLPFKRSTKS